MKTIVNLEGLWGPAGIQITHQTLQTSLPTSRRSPEEGLAEGGFGDGLKSAVFGVWAAPAGFKTHPKRWGASLPTAVDGFEAPRGRRDPENDRFPAKSQTPLC